MRARVTQFLPWLIVAAGFLLRLPQLNGSFWLDEAAQALESTRPLSQQFQIVEDFQPPLLHLLVHLAAYASRQEWWLRTIGALLPGLATLAATYCIGANLGGKKMGTIASVLLATSSFHIFYSQELRPYALPALLVTLSWLRVLRVKSRSQQFDLPLAVITFLGIFSSYLYPFALLSQIGYVWAARRDRLRSFLFSTLTAAFGFLPWLPFFMGQLAQGQTVRGLLPGWSAIVGIPQLKSLPLVMAKFIFGVLNVEPTAPFMVLGAICVTTLVICSYLVFKTAKHSRKADQQTRSVLTAVVWWLILPILAAWLISFVIPILQPKRVLFSLPAWYLGIAALYLFAENSRLILAKWLGRGLLGTIIFCNIWGTVQYYINPELQRENWREAYHQIVTAYPADVSVAVFGFPQPFASWRWYDTQSYPSLSAKTLRVLDETAAAQVLSPLLTNGYQYVILFDYLRDITDPERQFESVLGTLGYTERQVMEYPSIGFIRIYSKVEAATAYEYRH